MPWPIKGILRPYFRHAVVRSRHRRAHHRHRSAEFEWDERRIRWCQWAGSAAAARAGHRQVRGREPGPYWGWASTMMRISVMSSMAQRRPSRPRPESFTPPYGM